MLKRLIVLVAIVFATSVWAWEPSGPIRVVVGQSPGGTNELIMRTLGDIVHKQNPQVSFIVENRPGLDGVTAMNHFGEQRPDGQTILVATLESVSLVAPTIYRSQLRVDTDRFVPITLIAQTTGVLAVPINSPIRDMKDLTTRLHQGQKFNLGNSGVINTLIYDYMVNHLHLPKSQLQSINYNNFSSAAVALASGTSESKAGLDLGFVTPATVKPFLGTRIRLLAKTSNINIPGLEDVPAISQWIPGLDISVTWAVYLPAGTPPEVAQWYQTYLCQAINTVETRAFFYTNSISPKPTGLEELVRYKRQVLKTWQSTANNIVNEKQ